MSPSCAHSRDRSWPLPINQTIQIPGVPISIKPEPEIGLTVNCNDCRTYGEIIASISSEDGLSALLTFNRVGAHMDLDIVASNTLTVTLGLGYFFNPNVTLPVSYLSRLRCDTHAHTQQAGAFGANFGIGLNLVLSMTSEVTLNGGFQLCIPDGAELGFEIQVGDDPDSILPVFSSEIKTLYANPFSASRKAN